MRLPEKIYKGNIGTVVTVEIDTTEDISSAETLQLLVTKPGGSEVAWDGEYSTSDGKKYISYTTIEGDLDEAGDYYVQPYIDIVTWSGRGNTFKIKVWEYNS
jgi:hypothetical protein